MASSGPFEDAFAAIAADGTAFALVVRRGGEILVDLAAGTDRDGRPFTSSTPVFLYSAVKPVTALTVLLAAARGHVDLDATVASVWPAFGAHGKDRVTVAEALAHGAAVPGWREPMTPADLGDRERAAGLLAAAEPWWSPPWPGEHAVSYGHLLDAILRHATGRDVVAWWDDVVAATGVTVDLLPGAGARRPAPLDDPGGAWRDTWTAAEGLMGDLLRNPADLLDVDVINGPAGRSLIAPAVTGYGSAHDLADLWAWWSGPDVAAGFGAPLAERMRAPVLTGEDAVLGQHVAWGLGPQFEDDGSYGMGGVGGCVGWYEPDLDLAIGVTTPQVGSFDRLDPLDAALAQLKA